MKAKPLALIPLIIIMLTFTVPVRAKPNLKLLWTWPHDTDDVAVSADDKYLASINETTLTYFSVENRTLLWWFNETIKLESPYNMGILSVVISADGEYVAMGYGDVNQNGGLSYFNESTTRRERVDTPTGTQFYHHGSKDMGERGVEAMYGHF